MGGGQTIRSDDISMWTGWVQVAQCLVQRRSSANMTLCNIQVILEVGRYKLPKEDTAPWTVSAQRGVVSATLLIWFVFELAQKVYLKSDVSVNT